MGNFDGIIHRPGAVYPNARLYTGNLEAAPDGLSALLNEAFVYVREHSQLLFSRSLALGTLITDAAPHRIAGATSTFVPPHATGLVVDIRHVQTNPAAVHAYHYVRLLGSISDISSAVVQGQSGLVLASVLGSTFPIPPMQQATVYMPLNDTALAAAGISRTDLSFTVYGHGLSDNDTTAVDYAPASVTAYWVSEN